MFEAIWIDMTAFLGVVHVVSPIVLRHTMRFSTKCNPTPVDLKNVPIEVADAIRPRVAELAGLGFECVGTYDCGSLVSGTKTYGAYFCNAGMSDYASVTVMETAEGCVGYLEFSTGYLNGLTVETNNNGVPPLTPSNPAHRIFRFSHIRNASALYRVHKQLLEKYAPGLWPEAEPMGEELGRFVRVMENFAPRHARIGYMEPAEDSQSYKLTWKGACLMGWNGLWPTSFVRKIWQWHRMQTELQSLQVHGVTALKKA